MNKGLLAKAITRFSAGLLLVCLLLFLPAGTFCYPQAWLLMGILFIPMFIAGLVMLKKNPELLKKRLNVKEKETEQKEVILFSGIMFIAAFVSAGLSFRFGWLMLPFPFSSQSFSWQPTRFTPRSSGKTPIFPGPSKCRKIRK